MPIGKDSIKTRVAKVAADEPKIEAAKAESPAEVKPATKAATKKPTAPKKATAPKAPKAEGEAAAKAPAKKPAAPKKSAPKAEAKKPAAPKAEAPVADTPVVTPTVDTAVLANVSPETVAAVIGHDEKKPSDKVKIGQKMPVHLL